MLPANTKERLPLLSRCDFYITKQCDHYFEIISLNINYNDFHNFPRHTKKDCISVSTDPNYNLIM